MVEHASNPTIWKVGTGGLSVQKQPQMYTKQAIAIC